MIVNYFVEKFVKKWKKVEKFIYLCPCVNEKITK